MPSQQKKAKKISEDDEQEIFSWRVSDPILGPTYWGEHWEEEYSQDGKKHREDGPAVIWYIERQRSSMFDRFYLCLKGL